MGKDTKYAVFQSAGQRSRHIIAGAYSRFEIIPSVTGAASTNNVVLLGYANAGKPATLSWLSNEADAELLLEGGDLFEKVRYAFNPKGRDGNLRPQRLAVMPVNTNTQGTGYLKNGADNIITLKSRSYGASANMIQFKLEAGTTAGSKKLTEKRIDVVNVYDNIDATYLTVQYVGTGSACTLTIDGTTLTTSATGDAANNLSITLAGLTAAGLAAMIAANTAYTAVVVPAYSDKAATELDRVTTADIKTAVTSLKAQVEAIIDLINGSCQFIEATLGSNGRKVVDNVAYTSLTGASNGSYTSTEWLAALNALKLQDVNHIVICKDDSAVVAQLSAHLNEMNSVEGRGERQGLCGMNDLSAAQTLAVSLGNPALQICHGMITNYDSSNTLVEFDSCMYAAQIGGQKGALAIGESCGFEDVNAISARIATGGSLTAALEAGVTCLEITPDGHIRTNREISTYQGDNLELCLPSVVWEIYYMQRTLRALIEGRMTGKKGTPSRAASIDSLFKEQMAIFRDNDEIILSLGSDKPAWWNYVRTQDGNVNTITFNARVTAPMEFNFITSKLTIKANV